jgi:hypothetical protein
MWEFCLVRAVRRRRQPDRQCAAHARASRLDGRKRENDHRAAQRRDATRRRVRAQRAVQRRHASAGRDGDCAGVPEQHGARVLRRVARASRRHRRHHARVDAARVVARRRGGVLLDNVQLVAHGRFLDAEMRSILQSGRYPVRNVEQNLADLRAQVAACAKGAAELAKMVAHFGLPVVRAYMRHVRDNAEESVRRVVGARCGRPLRVRDGQRRGDPRRDQRRPRVAFGDDRFHRHERAAAEQFQCAVGRVQARASCRRT